MNCNHLPGPHFSMNLNLLNPRSEVYDRGCRGSLDKKTKDPSKDVCLGDNNVFWWLPGPGAPWYEKCCTWKNRRCLPKTKDDGKYTF